MKNCTYQQPRPLSLKNKLIFHRISYWKSIFDKSIVMLSNAKSVRSSQVCFHSVFQNCHEELVSRDADYFVIINGRFTKCVVSLSSYKFWSRSIFTWPVFRKASDFVSLFVKCFLIACRALIIAWKYSQVKTGDQF